MKKKLVKKEVNLKELRETVKKLQDVLFPKIDCTRDFSDTPYRLSVLLNPFEETVEEIKINKIEVLEKRIDELANKLDELEKFLNINYIDKEIRIKKYSKLRAHELLGKILKFIRY